MQKDKMNIVCFPGTLFDKQPYTNRQRVMIEMQKRGHTVVYVEPLKNPITQLAKAILGINKEQATWKWFKRLFVAEKRHQSLWVTSNIKLTTLKYNRIRTLSHFFNSQLLKLKLKRLGVNNPILWMYTPDAVDFAKWIPHSLLIYDCVDEYAAQPWYRDHFHGIKENEKDLLARADLVFTSAESLYINKKKQNENTYLLENVADFEHFNYVVHNNVEIPSELKNIKSPILGFVGAIDQYKLDIPSLIRIAKLKDDWNIVLIGPHGESEKAVDLSELKELNNIHLLGPKKYEDLPAYINGFDVCLIPYNQNEYTSGCFPLKFFEYLATGKPVVTSGLTSLKKYASYNIYTEDFDDFIQKIEDHLLANEEDEVIRRIDLAKKNTWGTKVDKMEKIINLKTNHHLSNVNSHY